ncbi:hypothetical protein RGUI_0201 [Rhodovulum sp. P5]|uniref:ester cyclase n=1 Tax=Rhodovulum sp. P5 TaxID=1564506 RepID=UPI0009C38CC3|nr:ester cyclase [Rhodovulum sp. P5]ARE38342.1 hypothetical protein RGUI_0201 [Rhodovulum sp. P5]
MPNSPRKARLSLFLDRVWSGGDASAVDEFVAESYTIHNDPGDPWEGQTLTRAGFRDRLVQSRAAAPDQTFTPLRMIEEGDSIAVLWDWAGTHLGDLPGVPATGRPIRMTGATVYDFDAEDRLTGHWQIADRLGVYRQITA